MTENEGMTDIELASIQRRSDAGFYVERHTISDLLAEVHRLRAELARGLPLGTNIFGERLWVVNEDGAPESEIVVRANDQ